MFQILSVLGLLLPSVVSLRDASFSYRESSKTVEDLQQIEKQNHSHLAGMCEFFYIFKYKMKVYKLWIYKLVSTNLFTEKKA